VFVRFFIHRPVAAAVLSLIVVLAGSIALYYLPITQYPEITPPTVEVSAIYPGANAQTVVDTVAAPIEQQVNGVEDMLYMSSQSTNDGKYTLTVTFRNGTDLNLAQILVQNRVSLAQPILPELVKRRGVTVKKKSPSIMMIINLYSPDGSRDNIYLSNYATIQLRDELSRINGVGDITYIGQRDYSMRVWLDPEQMAVRNLSPQDVLNAVEQQNVQVAAGQIGAPPINRGQAFQYNMTTLGRLSDTDQFGSMLIKADSEGRLIRLRDVARIELGAQDYDQVCTFDGKPSVALSVFQLPGSNALEVAKDIRAKLEELRDRFPAGLDYEIVYDTTPFITESIQEVFYALRDAIILVAIVVFVFLQSWRSAIIPLVAVPVAVVGTFAVMLSVGYSLNNLTLFGLVLAIGIVVDDAIVVVEAVEHHIEKGLNPVEATEKAMSEVAGPVIAIGLVLSAVFVPCLFIAGISGQFYRQFALTIAISTLISAFNSLTLSPALTALLLTRKKEPLPPWFYIIAGGFLMGWFGASWFSFVPESIRMVVAVLVGLFLGGVGAFVFHYLLVAFFWLFNVSFLAFTTLYLYLVRWALKLAVVVLLIYLLFVYSTWQLFALTPEGFIPEQDKGYLLVNVQLPESASLDRTSATIAEMEQVILKTPGVAHSVSIAGQSLLLGASSSHFGSIYVMLKPFEERHAPELSANALITTLESQLVQKFTDCTVSVISAPPVDGLGTAGGFKFILEDRGDSGLNELQQLAQQFVEEGNNDPRLMNFSSSFRADSPWLALEINRQEAKILGVPTSEIFVALQVYVGSFYVNDFNRFGRTWQVNVQADSRFRMKAEDIRRIKVRNTMGEMVPLGAFTHVKETAGPVFLTRYNLYPAASVNFRPAPGTSSGDAILAVEQIRDRLLPNQVKLEWTELALLQQAAGNTAMIVFFLSVVLVFLVLAAQYESWTLPLAVILVVPMCLFCAILGILLCQMDINIFTQVGFIVLVGLACKNAILIVEFAKLARERGASPMDATLQACQLRLRPILMTSFAFILGVVPLVVAEGAGAEMRRSLGVAVFFGMLGVTLFGIFLTPVFYYTIALIGSWFASPYPQPLMEAPADGMGRSEDVDG
jgi:multidrug efflux pump subunit AcrB